MGVLKKRKNCKWCQAITNQPKLAKRIYNSARYTGKGESLTAIANDVGLPDYSLRNHCKYHQGLTDDELSSQKLEKVAKATANQLIETNIQSTAARQDVIDKLHASVQGLDLNYLAAKDPGKLIDLLLKATKHSDDVKAKAKDQGMDWLKTMNSIRSGDTKPQAIEGEVVEKDFDPWKLDAAA